MVTFLDLEVWLILAGAINLANGNPYLNGDANLDGVVDGSDFIVWNQHKFTANSAWCSGDFTADGFVDGQDFIVWNQFKFMSSDVMSPMASHKEPAEMRMNFRIQPGSITDTRQTDLRIHSASVVLPDFSHSKWFSHGSAADNRLESSDNVRSGRPFYFILPIDVWNDFG